MQDKNTSTAAAVAFADADAPTQRENAAYRELLALAMSIQKSLDEVLAERKPSSPVRFHVWGEGSSSEDSACVVVTLSDSKRNGQYRCTKYDVTAMAKRYGGPGYMVTKNAAWVTPKGVRNIFSRTDDAFAGKFALTYAISGSRVVHNGVAGAAADMVSELAAKYPDREILREAMTRAGLTAATSATPQPALAA